MTIPLRFYRRSTSDDEPVERWICLFGMTFPIVLLLWCQPVFRWLRFYLRNKVVRFVMMTLNESNPSRIAG